MHAASAAAPQGAGTYAVTIDRVVVGRIIAHA